MGDRKKKRTWGEYKNLPFEDKKQAFYESFIGEKLADQLFPPGQSKDEQLHALRVADKFYQDFFDKPDVKAAYLEAVTGFIESFRETETETDRLLRKFGPTKLLAESTVEQLQNMEKVFAYAKEHPEEWGDLPELGDDSFDRTDSELLLKEYEELIDEPLPGLPTDKPPDSMLTTVDVAFALRKSGETIRRYLGQKKLVGYVDRKKERPRYYVDAGSLHRFLVKNMYDLDEVRDRLVQRLNRPFQWPKSAS